MKEKRDIAILSLKKIILSIVALSLLYIVCCRLTYAGTEINDESRDKNEVIVVGTSEVKGENTALAKQAAISQALMMGVDNYLLSRLGTRGVADNFERIGREITTKSREEIESFNIVSECRINNTYKVLVRIRINEALMNRNLREAGLILPADTGIRILIMISETWNGTTFFWWKDPERYTSLGVVELALSNLLQQRGVTPVDRMSGVPDARDYTDLKSLYLQDKDIVRWGRLFSADVVIYGHAELTNQRDISLNLIAIDVNSGNRIYRDYEVEEIKNGTEGAGKEEIVKGAERLVSHMAPRLLPAVLGPDMSGRKEINHIEVTLEGLRNLKQLRMFREFLKSRVEGVRSVVQSRVSRAAISLSVEFEGDTHLLLDRLLHHAELPFPLTPAAAEGKEIILKISRHGRSGAAGGLF